MTEKINLRAFILVAFLIVIFFSPLLFSNQTFFYSDTTYLFRPFKSFIAEELKNFSIPGWNPFFDAGMPLLSDPVMQVFYPLNFIFMTGDISVTYKLFVITHYLLAGVFMYMLASKLGLKRNEAFFPAIAYMFSGYLVFIHYNLPFLAGAAFLPFFFYSLICLAESNRLLLPCAMLALSMSLQFTGGDVEIVYVEMLIALSYLIIRGLGSGKKTSGQLIRKNALQFLMSVIFFILLSSIVIVPLLYLYPHTDRALGMTAGDIYRFSLQPLQSCELAVPYFFGNMTEGTRFLGSLFPSLSIKEKDEWAPYIYCGTVTFFFILFLSFSGEKKKEERFFLFLFVFFLLASFGRSFVIYPLLVKILPLFSSFRYPAKLIVFTACSVSILGGMGFARWSENEGKRGNSDETKALRFSAVTLITIPFLFILSVKLFAGKTLTGENLFTMVLSSLTLLAITALILAVTELAGRGKLERGRASVVIMFILLIDLWIPGLRSYFTIEEKFFKLKPLALSRIEYSANNADKSSFRILRLESFKTAFDYRELAGKTTEEKSIIFKRNSLMPASGVEYGVQFAGAYSSYRIADFSHLEKEISGTQVSMDILNIRYIIAPFSSLAASPYSVKYKHPYGEFIIYENPDYLPRAFLVKKARYFNDRAEILDYMKGNVFSPKDEVLLEGNPEEVTPVPSPADSSGWVKITNYKPDLIEITASSDIPSFLVLADTWFPGWSAEVDGRKTELLRANYCFRALPLQEGTHKAVIRFTHPGFKTGAAITLFSLLAFILLVIIKRGPRETPIHDK